MIHGGFWRSGYNLSHASHLCAKLAQHGIVVASLEYRRVGNVGGGWRGSYEDVLAAFDAAKCFLPKPEKFVVLGHSAGGHLALRLAVRPKRDGWSSRAGAGGFFGDGVSDEP